MLRSQKLPHLGTDSTAMRCVVDDKGDLAFVSPALGWALGKSAISLTHQPLRSVIKIISSLDSHHQSLDLSTLQSGLYEVALLHETRDPILVQARIDIVTATDNKKMTVLWVDPDHRAASLHKKDASTAGAQDLALVVNQNQKKSQNTQHAAKAESKDFSASDSELRHFLHLSNDLMGVFGRNLSFVRANPTFCRVLEFTEEDLKNKSFIDLVHREEKDHILTLLQKLSHKGNEQEASVHFECRMPNKSGSFCWIDWSLKALGDYIYAVGRDVTGIKEDIAVRVQHEKSLRAAKETAEQAYASKTRFLANMSHELRTPLNAVIGFSEMIQRQLLGPLGNNRYLEYIGGIRQSGEHLLNLINDILDMSKIEIGKYELYIEGINVGKTIQLALHMVESRAHESQIKLVADKIPENLQISADRRAVMQVLLNLLSNAVKFTPAGGTIEVSCEELQNGVQITVKDTGIGIPKDKIDIVTLPFEQVDSELTRQHEGSGLGLAITKELVGLHGGTLKIESDVGKGTTVTVNLPFEVAQKNQAQKTA